MKSLAKTFLFLICALLIASLPASGTLLDLEFGKLPQDWFNPAVGSMIARLADGSYAVVWLGEGYEARLQWVRPDGSEILEPGGRPFATPTNREFPTVVAHPAAGAFVAFAAVTGRGWRVLVQSFDGAGSPRWPGDGVLALDAPGIEYQKTPRLLAGADGGAFVCFGRSADLALPDRDQTICQRLAPDGRPLWPGGRVVGRRPGEHLMPSLVADGKGGLLAFWTTTRTLISGGRQFPLLTVEGQRLSPDGALLWDPRGSVLHETDGADDTFLAFDWVLAVTDGRGGAILAFADQQGTRRGYAFDDVLAQRVDGGGALLWGQGIRLASGPIARLIDSLTATPDGGAAAVVREVTSGSESRLVLYRLGPRGLLRPKAEGVVLSAPNRAQLDFGSQGSFDGGRLRILWSSHVLGSALHVEVRIAVFDLAGRRLTAPDSPPLAAWGPAEGRTFAGFAFDAGRDQGLAVWDTLRAFPQGLDLEADGALFSGAGAP